VNGPATRTLEAKGKHVRELRDKVAVVTGGGDGIGRGIATVMARHGAHVVVADISSDKAKTVAAQIEALDRRSLPILQDVADLASSDSVLSAAIGTFGQVDILVNNVGVASQVAFDALTEAEWDRINDINSKALFFSCQTYGRYFRDRKAGKIVNISSYVGKEAIVEYAHYCASKAAVIAITQSVAKELAAHGVNVNAVCPGIVRTPMWDGLNPDQWAMQEPKIPLGRGQTVEDIGEAVSFLASERARNITGMTLGVTGGLAVW
jgi:meso-butanediol dehydrogenase / (S,S)-butanediol dehydrogenase / diacetyl reductase